MLEQNGHNFSFFNKTQNFDFLGYIRVNYLKKEIKI